MNNKFLHKFFIFLLLMTSPQNVFSQGRNHQWLLGDQTLAYPKARMFFDSSSYILQNEFRKMMFNETEATICDNNGNFLMSSNGIWIANANNDTMMNGSGLNPGPLASSNINSDGLLLPYANIILPYPNDTSKYILFHHTATDNGKYYIANEILYSIIDMTLDSGLGGVISKNDTAFMDTLNWGLAACKHANGRDWWIVAQKDTSDIIFKILLTPYGITSVTSQHLNVPIAWANVTQPTFSPDGTKFGYQTYIPNTDTNFVLLFDFDRCTGMFSNQKVINITDGYYSFGLSFSPNSQFVYASSQEHIFQIDVNTQTLDTVATYDGFAYPIPGAQTTFDMMYLAANGKIYIAASTGGCQHIHEMNFPDSVGLSCDVQQHAIFMNAWVFVAVPNHPNYYLGPVIGSVCDSLAHVGLQEHFLDVQNFNISPNPISNGALKITYLLPQNKSGVFTIYDTNGKNIYSQLLPEWSSLQNINLPFMVSGIYYCSITSGSSRATKKLVVMH